MGAQSKLNQHNLRNEKQYQRVVYPLGFHNHLNIAKVGADAITCKTSKSTSSDRKPPGKRRITGLGL